VVCERDDSLLENGDDRPFDGRHHAGALADKAQASCLRFDRQNDALDLGGDCVQGGNDWMASQSLDFAKSYQKGEVELVLEFAAGANNANYHLVFFAIPDHLARNISWGIGVGTSLEDTPTPNCANGGAADWGDETVKALPTRSVQCDDEIVPSWVRLEGAKERKDLRREALTASAYGVLKLSGIVRDGELNNFRSRYFTCNGNGVSSLIKSGSKCFQRLIGRVREGFGKLPLQLDLVGLANTIRVQLNDSNIGLFFEEPLKAGIQCTNMMICTPETPFWTVERIGTLPTFHGIAPSVTRHHLG